MTTRRRKQEQALFAPRLRKPWRDDPYDPAHRTQLDTGPEELTSPAKTVDNPRNHPLRSDTLMTLTAMINLRLAEAGMPVVYATKMDEDGDEVQDPVATFHDLGLTPQECRVWQLHLLGFSSKTIRQFVPVEVPALSHNGNLSEATVERYIKRCRAKVRAHAI